MSKVIIDNNLIDLEMITHIEMSAENYFDIHLVGKKSIRISRYPWKSDTFVHDRGSITTIPMASKETLAAVDKAKASLDKMYDELVKRWSPNTIKFDDLTVK